jgi:hypothetical protein
MIRQLIMPGSRDILLKVPPEDWLKNEEDEAWKSL